MPAFPEYLLKDRDMPLRLVFFNRSFYPDITATGQLLTELCEDLVKAHNCQGTVIAGQPMRLPASQWEGQAGLPALRWQRQAGVWVCEDFKGIEILRVNNTSFSPKSFLGRILNYLSYFIFSFIASFKLEKPDLVITLTDPPIIGLIGLWVSFRFNIPLIISVRDIFPEVARGLENSQNKILNFILDKINRFCLQKAKHVVCLGKLMHKKLVEEKNLNSNKVSIIPDWADCAQIYPTAKKNPFSISHNLADFFVVMYSGNIGASSGLEILIDSAKILKDYKDILFVIIGEGIIKDKLINLAQSYNLANIRFLPYQPKDKLSYSFSSADIFIIPLKKGLAGYSVPSKLYGILASGRPYIACVEEESEIAQITKRFDCGLVASPQDPLDLTKKIIFLYENINLKQKMGENARKAAVFFDRGLGVQAYYELFNGIGKYITTKNRT